MFPTLVALVALLAASVASVTGFGIGSLLTPTLALHTGTKLAVAAVSIPHLVGTTQRFWLLRGHVDRRVLLGFGIASALGGLTGALVHASVSSRSLALVFGVIVALAGVSELTGWMRRVHWGRRSAWAAGAVSGALGGMVGNQGGIRTAALLGFDVPKESFVATATAIGLFVDGARMPVYLATEWRDIIDVWPLVLTATVGVVVGTALGARVLGRLPQQVFRRVIAMLLIALGLYMALGAHRAEAQSCIATRSSMTPARWVAPRASTGDTSTGALELVADLPLPGPANRFDYQSIDPVARRLYISHMNAGRLVVFDLDSARVVSEVAGLDRATGVLAVPARHAVYVSAARRHELVALDDRTLKVTGRVGGIRFPDGVAYAPVEGKVFVSDENGGADIVIDARTMTKRRSIDLGGEAGNTHYDSVSHCILVAVQTRNQLVAIDPANERIVARYDLPGVDGPHGFTLDEAGRRAFITGEGDATLVVLDLRTMRITQRLRVGEDPDVLAWDAGLQRLYVASESGVVAIFSAATDTLRALGQLRAPHAHTVAVDPRTHRVYLPLENVGGRPVLRILAPAGTPRHHSGHG